MALFVKVKMIKTIKIQQISAGRRLLYFMEVTMAKTVNILPKSFQKDHARDPSFQ